MDEPTTTENYDQKSELDAVRSELKELNAEFKLVRGFQDSIIRTSQWALTTVFALGALLVGFHWYTNNDAIERQRALIAEEVTSDLKKGLIADFQSLESQSKADLARFEDKTKANIEGDIVDLKLKLLRASALTDSSPSERLSASIDYLKLAVSTKRSLGAGLILLKNTLEKSEYLNDHDRAEIETALGKVNSEKSIEMENIRQQVERLPTLSEALDRDTDKVLKWINGHDAPVKKK